MDVFILIFHAIKSINWLQYGNEVTTRWTDSSGRKERSLESPLISP